MEGEGGPGTVPSCRYITQQGNKLETGKSRVPSTVTNAVSWRSEGLKYKKNEVFIDVIESVNLLVRLAPPLKGCGVGHGRGFCLGWVCSGCGVCIDI